MDSSTNVRRGPVQTDPHLRALLRAARRAAGDLSQRAAARQAGISLVYWQKIESGKLPAAPAGTLAVMFAATGARSGQLQDEGYPRVASAMDELAAVSAPEPSAEDHLAATPGASAEEISALQAVWRALRAKRTTDPLEPDIEQNHRRNSRK
jgi:Helix-turn-helix domain